MELEDAITVTKIELQNQGECYLMIDWQLDSFDVYLFNKENFWKGHFSASRLHGFSKNLHVSDVAYFESLKKCLSQTREDYIYELRTGFFYWKRQINDLLLLEGFLPVTLEPSKNTQPDLIGILISINNHLKQKVNGLKHKFETIKSDYQQCLRDTEEFMDVKIDMERTLRDKFLALLEIRSRLEVRKSEVGHLLDKEITLLTENLD